MQSAPLTHITDPNDLHAQIQAMIAAAQGAPMPPQAPQMPMPQGMPPPPMQSMGGTQAPAMPQMGGSPQNVQKAMLAQAIRGS